MVIQFEEVGIGANFIATQKGLEEHVMRIDGVVTQQWGLGTYWLVGRVAPDSSEALA